MDTLRQKLIDNPVFYVTRDIERAFGLESDIQGYFIISNSTPFSKQIANGWPSIFLVEEDHLLDTQELLNHPQVQKFISESSLLRQPNILVFKNTSLIENICAEKNWHLLNPSALLAQKVEEKISQVEWLDDLRKYLPPHKIQTAKEVDFDGTPFILQFNRAHTGLGTMLISSDAELKEIQTKFPDRPVRITQFISGPMFTNNNVVTPNKILLGNINYQITGLSPFTDKPFATIGNDWGIPHKLLQPHHFEKYTKMATAIGEKLRNDGWKGLFGIDVIYDSKADDIFLIEINARQPASTTYESFIQDWFHQDQKTSEITTFEAHIASLLNIDLTGAELVSINDGAQIIARNTVEKIWSQNQSQTQKILEQISTSGFPLTAIPYANTEPGSDGIRIQSKQSLMQNHNAFNEIGEKIKQILL